MKNRSIFLFLYPNSTIIKFLKSRSLNENNSNHSIIDLENNSQSSDGRSISTFHGLKSIRTECERNKWRGIGIVQSLRNKPQQVVEISYVTSEDGFVYFCGAIARGTRIIVQTSFAKLSWRKINRPSGTALSANEWWMPAFTFH